MLNPWYLHIARARVNGFGTEPDNRVPKQHHRPVELELEKGAGLGAAVPTAMGLLYPPHLIFSFPNLFSSTLRGSVSLSLLLTPTLFLILSKRELCLTSCLFLDLQEDRHDKVTIGLRPSQVFHSFDASVIASRNTFISHVCQAKQILRDTLFRRLS